MGEHVRLPHELGVNGHCMARVNQSHIIITGGATGTRSTGRIILSSSYMYSEDGGFTEIEDMKTPRSYHGCSVINETVLFVSGGLYGEGIDTEYLDLTTLTWADGPELPNSTIAYEDTEMMEAYVIGKQEVFELEELGLTSDERKWQWVKVGELEDARGSFRPFLINGTFCQ